MNYTYGQFSNKHLNESREGIELFNEQKYWECHEVFEDLWKEDVGDNARNVWWAIIQVAASMIHYRDKKLPGAKSLIHKAKEKIERCENLGVDTQLMYDYLDWQELKDLVYKVPKETELSDLSELFEFRFKNFPKENI